jgi:MFS family permease
VSLAIGYFGLGMTVSPVPLVITGLLAAFGNSVLRPVLTSLITQHAGRQEQGMVLGITQSLMSLASIVAPVASGLLIQHGMLATWAWAAAALACVGVIISRQGWAEYSQASTNPVGAP